MKRSLGPLCACAAAALVVAGCGGGELPAKRGLPANTVLVTQKDIVKYRPHTPERTLMAWWRSMQYTDARGYLAQLAEPLKKARQKDRAYRVQLPLIARQVDDAFPHIKLVDVSDDRATVYVEIEFRQLVGADKYATTRVAQAFTLVRERGTWRIADDLFVEAGVQDQLRALAQQDAKAGVRPPAVVTPAPGLAPTPEDLTTTTTTPDG